MSPFLRVELSEALCYGHSEVAVAHLIRLAEGDFVFYHDVRHFLDDLHECGSVDGLAYLRLADDFVCGIFFGLLFCRGSLCLFGLCLLRSIAERLAYRLDSLERRLCLLVHCRAPSEGRG